MGDTTIPRVGAFQSLRADFVTYIRHERYLRDKHAGSASEPVMYGKVARSVRQTGKFSQMLEIGLRSHRAKRMILEDLKM